MPRKMRTIDQAFSWICENDPETALTKTALRRLVVTKQLPCVVMVGRKYLIDLDGLNEYMSGNVPKPDNTNGKIRRIEA